MRRSVNDFTSPMSEKSVNLNHKEVFSARVKRNHDDYIKLKAWFKDHNPFEIEKSCCLGHWLNWCVTCDRAEEVGAEIQAEMTGEKLLYLLFQKE